MKRRVWVCIGLIVWSELLVGKARGQIAPTLGSPSVAVPVIAKSAGDATPYRAQIQQFVDSQVTALTGQDPIAQKAARERLIAECTSGSNASYFDVYSQIIDATATQILKRNPPLRVRLNVAVLVFEVGKIVRNKALEGSVILLINDSSDPIAMRGMQAAHPVIAALVSNPAQVAGDKLMAAILPAVKAHAKSGFVAAEAYHALIPDDTVSEKQRASVYALVLGPILDLLNYRISLYTTGIPDNPAAEIDVPTFIYRAYKSAPPALQNRAVQTLVDLISVAGQQATGAAKPELEEIIQTLIYASQVLSANIPSVTGSLQPVVGMSKGTAAATVAQRAKAVYGLLKPSLSFLKPPPNVVTSQPTTEEAN